MKQLVKTVFHYDDGSTVELKNEPLVIGPTDSQQEPKYVVVQDYTLIPNTYFISP